MAIKQSILISILSLFFSFSIQAQRMAYIYGDTVLKSLPQYGIRVAKLDSVNQSYQKEIVAEQNVLQQKLNKLMVAYSPKATETVSDIKNRMTSADTLSLNLLINSGKQIQDKRIAYDKIIQASFNKEVQPLLDKIKKIVNQYARDNKLSMVVMYEQLKGALAYIDPKEDITRQIIGLLSKEKIGKVN
jgi:Skp family chaperone for outer membrane proteins